MAGDRNVCPRCGGELGSAWRFDLARTLFDSVPIHEYHVACQGCGARTSVEFDSMRGFEAKEHEVERRFMEEWSR